MANEEIKFKATVRTAKGTVLNSGGTAVTVVDTSKLENTLSFTYGASSTVASVTIRFSRKVVKKVINGVEVPLGSIDQINTYPGNGTHKVEVSFDPAEGESLIFNITDNAVNTTLYSVDKFPENFLGIQIKSNSNFRVPSALPNSYKSTNYMFAGCIRFNQPLNHWNVSNITNMNGMFSGCTVFNQPIGNWNTVNVTDMGSMFYACTNFNQNINSWNTSKVSNIEIMFAACANFNQPLNNWNTGSVTSMQSIFSGCINFNQNINNWNVSNVITMESAFYGCTAFNSPLNSWNVSKVIQMQNMFNGCVSFNQPLNNWNTANVFNMNFLFNGCRNFNQNINSWNVSKVTTFAGMFVNCSAFNQPLNNWNTASAIDMHQMFFGCNIFNQPLYNWDVSKVTRMDGMFTGCTSFNQFLNAWCVALITSKPESFDRDAPNFTENKHPFWGTCPRIERDPMVIQVSGSADMLCSKEVMAVNIQTGQLVKSTYGAGSNAFDGSWLMILPSTGTWGLFDKVPEKPMGGLVVVSGLTEVKNWYRYGYEKEIRDYSNYPILMSLSSDKLVKVPDHLHPSLTNLSGIFVGAAIFNDPSILKWDLSNVVSLFWAFQSAKTFNQPIGVWNVRNVTNMSGMLESASSFNQNLSGWCVSKIPGEPERFSTYTPLSAANKPRWGTCPNG